MRFSQGALNGGTPTPPRDGLGCALAALSCQQELAGSGFSIYRKTYGGPQMSRLETPPSGRGLLVGVALAGGHRRRIFEGNRSALHEFAAGSCYVRSFSEAYRADAETEFDFFLLEISRPALRHAFDELGLADAEGLSFAPGAADPVLAHLAGALVPALAAPQRVTPLFLDQVACAMQSHLAARYHGGPPRSGGGGGGLPRRVLMRAKELLDSHLDGQVLIGDVAAACGLSRSAFIRGFKTATGATPYQWLLGRRVERARDLLLNSSLPLADVASCCRLSDQSHMTRTVTRLAGAAPGAWRRG